MKKIFSTILFLGVMLSMTLLVDVKAYANPGDPLCFTAAVDNTRITLIKNGSPAVVSLQTSTNLETWTDYTPGTYITLPTVGSKLYFRNISEVDTNFTTLYGEYLFDSVNRVYCSGDITTLLNKNGTYKLSNYCFKDLFSQISLLSAPELPATELAMNCYYNMFYGCNLLTEAPELPATVLPSGCYEYMFGGCTSLQKAPDLGATDIDAGCYFSMFEGCTNLNYIKVAFPLWYKTSEVWDPEFTLDWLKGVSPSGTFICVTELPEKRGASYIPEGWERKDLYKVTFDANGHGTAPQTQHIAENDLVNCPPILIDGDYYCIDWYKEAGCINKWDFDIDVVTDNMTLYAKWSIPINPLSGGVYLINSGTTTLTKKDSKTDLDNSESACYFYDETNKKLYVKYIDGTAPDPVYITKTKTVHDTKEVIKEVEKIISPQTITVVDEKGNRRQATLNSDGTYTIINSSITPVQTISDLDRKALLKDLPSKGIKLVIGLDECGIDGVIIKQDAPAEVIDGVTFLPIRLIAEYLGAKVSWDEKTPDKVEITKGSKKIILTIGSKVALVNGKEYTLDYAPYIKYDRTYLPVRFISEHLGAVVEWSEKSPYEIIIK